MKQTNQSTAVSRRDSIGSVSSRSHGRRRLLALSFLTIAPLLMCACAKQDTAGQSTVNATSTTITEKTMKTENRTIRLAIGGTDYTATLADTDAARLLAERLPMRLSMTELNGNEKYANLDKPLPTKTEKVRRIEAGDVMLWGDNCLVVFYKSFDTPYSYTRIGRISDAKGLAKSLGNGDAEVVFQRNENVGSANKGETATAEFYNYTLLSQTGETVKMDRFKGKVVLIVNTATACGFTPQYEPLEKIYRKLHAKGLEIIDIPCNQFGSQAPGTDEEIHTFCTLNYNTTFPQMKKSDVNGEHQLPLYAYLKSQKGFNGFGEGKMADLMRGHLAKINPGYENSSDIKWNFTKFVIDRAGNVVARFEPTADMEAVKAFIMKEIQK